jgi:serralysin
VRSAVTFVIQSSVEILILTGAANINGVGNGHANEITGNAGRNHLAGNGGDDRLVGGAGNDVLVGGPGNDILTGSGGHDAFVFRNTLDRDTNVDRILDFTPADDVIRIDNAVFAGLSAGALSPGAFRIGPEAADPSDRIVYNRSNGVLLFDANGNAAGGVTRFAILDPGLDLGSGHFFVI